MKPLVIIDTSVIAHNLYNRVDQMTTVRKTKYPPRKLLNLITEMAYGLYMINYWADGLDTDILWVGDSKPYWRKAVYPEYKSNRHPEPDKSKFIQRFYSYVRPLTIPNYEADDIAAAIVRTYGQERKIILLTIDSDWLQMVSENILWVCANGQWAPQYRDTAGAIVWFKNKISKESKKVQAQIDTDDIRQIVDWKVLVGDKSDNIPSLVKSEMDFRPLIDLLNPQQDLLKTMGFDLFDRHVQFSIKPHQFDVETDFDQMLIDYSINFKYLPTKVCDDMRHYDPEFIGVSN